MILEFVRGMVSSFAFAEGKEGEKLMIWVFESKKAMDGWMDQGRYNELRVLGMSDTNHVMIHVMISIQMARLCYV